MSDELSLEEAQLIMFVRTKPQLARNIYRQVKALIDAGKLSKEKPDELNKVCECLLWLNLNGLPVEVSPAKRS